MKSVHRIILVSFILSFFTGSALGQKSEFKNAIKKDIRSFDGSYYVDLSKKDYSPREIREFASKNGYTLKYIQEGTVSVFGTPKKAVRSVNMLPYGASPNVEKGHANPADEPYKTIAKLFSNALKKKPRADGTYDVDFTDRNLMGHKMYTDMLEYFREVARAQHCFFPKYASEIDWASGRQDGLLTHIYLVPESQLPERVLRQSFSNVTKQSNELKTGKVKIDPEKNEWVDGVLWTGNVIGGKISGSGHGIKITSMDWKSFKMEGLIVDGIFKDGLPVGETKYRYGKIDKNGHISLYGKYQLGDHERKDAGVSLVQTPQIDPGIILLEKSKTTIDIWGKIDKHDIQYGYVDNDFSLLFWIPISSENIEFVQPFKNGKAIIKEKKMVDHGWWRLINDKFLWRKIFNNDERWISYDVSSKGEFSIADVEKTELLSFYDKLMGYWDIMLKPYYGDKGSFEDPSAWDYLKAWNIYIGLFYQKLAADGPMEVLRSNRSNIDKYETLRQLIRLNELAYSTAILNFNYSTIYDHPYWAKNLQVEGERIMTSLRENAEFNPPYKDSVFTQYSALLEEHVKAYETLYNKAVDSKARRRQQVEEDMRKQKEELCTNCKVDGSKSTIPKGYKDETSFLIIFGQPAQSEESGELVLKNGKKVEWKYIYKDGKKYILANGDYIGGLDKYFDNEQEMIDYIIERCKTEFCN